MTKDDKQKLGTEELLRVLAQSQPRAPLFPLWLFCLLAVFVSMICTLSLLGLRTDAGIQESWAGMAGKTLFLCAIALAAAAGLKKQSAPLPVDKPFMALYVLLAFLMLLVAAEWLLRPAADILAGFAPRNFATCLLSVTLYGTAGLAALTRALRDYAPADSRRAAAVAAIAAGAAGAVGYSLHCRVDSPTFILVAYGLPILALALAARIFVPRYLRW
ncbi:MAG: NrsF family protein [Alphaproteobacteria bacterium]